MLVNNKKKALILVLSLILILMVSACTNQNGNQQNNGQNENQELEKVTVMLDWVPNTNHTGLYAAQEQGYYEDQGLEVEIVQPSQGTAEQLVATGKADFGISYQEGLIQARAADVPIVSLAAVIQHNTSALAAPKDKGILTPTDYEGKKYGSYGSPIEEAIVRSLMEKHGADPNKVEIINIGAADFFTTVEKDVDFAWIYYAWTGIEAELRDVPLDMVWVKDEDPEALDYYTPILITTEDQIANNPDLVKKFMTATSQGYQFAIENPDEAAEILLKGAPELDPELVKASQRWLADEYQADAAKWGLQKEEVWQNFTQWLLDRDLIENKIDINKAYTNQFLPE